MNTRAVTVSDEKKKSRAALALIWLCWLAYTCSYIGKVNYAANINQVMSFYGVDHAAAGLVSTFLFFSYGVGQFVNGFLCKKYNLKWIIFASLMVSGIINLAVALTPSFEIVKYLWLVNGFALSVLWPCVIRLLSENLSKKYMAKASVIMGTTVASGTFAIYAASAVFASFNAFKLAFIAAAVFMPLVALIWIFSVSKITEQAREATADDDVEEQQAEKKQARSGADAKTMLFILVGVLAVYAIVTNLIKDGLTTWIPSILKENYGLDDSFSIILSLALPLVAVFSNFLAVAMNKRIPDFVAHCAVNFTVAGVIIGVVIGGLSLGQFAITLIGFAVVCFLASACNNTITSIFPLYMKDKVNSGMMAGVLNGCCYIGSTAASYGLGLVADNLGWSAVFWLLLFACVAAVAIALVYFVIKKSLNKNKG